MEKKHLSTLLIKLKQNTNLLKLGNKFLSKAAKRQVYFSHIYVVASMPAPPFFLGGRPAGHQYPKCTLKTPHHLCALAGGRYGDRPPKHWPWPRP